MKGVTGTQRKDACSAIWEAFLEQAIPEWSFAGRISVIQVTRDWAPQGGMTAEF